MKLKSLVLSTLAVALALGTAWAVRGKFGHEQGAAWAGAIGALALVRVARREDWCKKGFRILMAAAIGWGISGVMSYGAIVGYGRATDFLNAFYGLLMLFLLGLLYGFIGGGFFGLALVESPLVKVKWYALITQMVALGLLTYGLLINQLGWLMTPPRSEMWAACLGAAIALGWFIQRHRLIAPMRVAVWSALGAGFGFAFGNFLQVMGSTSGIAFNFWNVMEYSIGFFGGAGMAYGTLTSSWATSDHEYSPAAEWLPLLFVTAFIPFVVWQQSFVTDRFDFITDNGGSTSAVFTMKLLAGVAIVLVALTTIGQHHIAGSRASLRTMAMKRFFLLYICLYIFLSFLVTGVFVHPIEQYLYILNLVAILFLISREGDPWLAQKNKRRWVAVAALCVVVIALLALIAITSHGELPGSHQRFVSV